ncbi:Probable pre-mRNA-splicing factor ATP-dependent RNA helicase mog-4 [Geodia barretti]|uniref:Probable pre-mRNA-splicing factor ATP-dependent RNA helicase mog-4 n=1 Tax=Geodia barretti TaxID=519541 RepID=A0AA35RKI1_GEOBA|nr:Probable pre-mRNA-splicing factor ATP-dependent RNA helicase mog-4 [Geodia barretti]
MAGIVSWVSERLHEILGLSDRQIAEFMIELARKSKSSRDLTKKLQKSGTIEVNSDVEGFAAELWSRCVEGTSGKQSAERSGKQVTVDEKSRATKASRNIRSQRATEEWESDEEDVRPPSGADDSDSDEWERVERERREDLAERDAFSERVRMKDKEKTRHIVERSDKKSRQQNEK